MAEIYFEILNSARVMDSKKKPLWLTCENHDDLGTEFLEMYKVILINFNLL